MTRTGLKETGRSLTHQREAEDGAGETYKNAASANYIVTKNLAGTDIKMMNNM